VGGARLARGSRSTDATRGLRSPVRSGRIPLWNRWIFSGTPFLANFQPGVFYPPNLVLACTGLSLPDQMTAYLVFHLLLAVTGMYVFLRLCRVRPLAALIGGVVLGWSGYNAARTGIPTMVATGAWLPWAMASTRRWFEREDGRSWGGMALSLGMSGLAGFAQIFVFTFYAWALHAVVEGLFRRPRLRPRRWLGPVSAGAVGGLLVAVHLAPTLEFTRLAQDATNSPEMLGSGTIHPWVLGKLVVPDLLGNPRDENNATHHLGVGAGYYHQTERSTALYVGILPLLLASVVLLSPGDRRRAAAVGLGLAIGGILFALRTPLTSLAPSIPGLGFSRPDRATFLWCTGVAVLAGVGAERMASREGPGAARAANGLAAGIGLAALAFATAVVLAGETLLPPAVVATLGDGYATRAGLLALPSAALALALHGLRTRDRIGGRAFLIAALALVAADLGRPAQRMNILQPEESVYRPARAGGSLAWLTDRRSAEEPIRILRHEPLRSPTTGVLPPSTGALYGLEDVLGFDSINLARYRELLESLDPEIVVRRGNFRGTRRAESLALPLVDLLNVRYVLAASPEPLPGLELAHASDLAVHENRDVLPRAFLVDEVRVLEDPAALRRAMALPSFRPDLWAYAESPIPGVPERPADAFRSERPDLGAVRILSYGDEKVRIEVEPRGPALLVLTDAHYPGWKASVDGEARPIHRVNHVFRGVGVRPGDREIVFTYEPSSFRVGAALSLAGLVALGIGTVGFGRTAPRRAPPAGSGTTPRKEGAPPR
jgi:hypothetical protein